jgi:hypothetical protein
VSDPEVQAKHDFEETRRCMLKVYASHIQTHTGLLIAVIIGAFTLISRFTDFYTSTNNEITFLSLLSIIVGATFYLLIRIFYWSFCDNCTIIARYSFIKRIRDENLKEIKSQNGEVEKEPISETHALMIFIRSNLKDPTQFDADAKLTFYHRLAGLNKLGQIALVVIATLLSFFIFLFINGFLWH